MRRLLIILGVIFALTMLVKEYAKAQTTQQIDQYREWSETQTDTVWYIHEIRDCFDAPNLFFLDNGREEYEVVLDTFYMDGLCACILKVFEVEQRKPTLEGFEDWLKSEK